MADQISPEDELRMLEATAQDAATTEEGSCMHMEAAYLLDCAVELGEITPMEAMVFTVRTPAAETFIRLASGNALPKHWLRNTARQYLDSLPQAERFVWALRGMEGLEFGVRSFQDRVAFMVQTKVQSDLGVDERHAIHWMDEAGPALFEEKQFASVHDVTAARVQQFIQATYGEAKARLEDDLALLQEALTWVALPGNRDEARRIAQRVFSAIPVTIDEARLHQAPSVRDVQRHKVKRQARSAIKKALKLFYRTGQEHQVRMLVQGKEITLSHPDSPFKFVLQPLAAGWLEQKTVAPGGHVPYQLTLLTKEDVFLSRLCVLFDATPVLDQLLALTFFVHSGNEEAILKKANWFGYESPAAVREVLMTKAPALVAKIPAPTGKPHHGLSMLNERYDAKESHWAPYAGPVRSWIQSWLGEVTTALASVRPVLAIA